MKKNTQPEPKKVAFQEVATGKGFLVSIAIQKKYAKRGILLH